LKDVSIFFTQNSNNSFLNTRSFKCLFGSMVAVVFQSIFHFKRYQIMFFYKKNYFWDQRIKTIQNMLKKLIFNKNNFDFLKNTGWPGFSSGHLEQQMKIIVVVASCKHRKDVMSHVITFSFIFLLFTLSLHGLALPLMHWSLCCSDKWSKYWGLRNWKV
jgi:hypothetical protein